MQFLGVRPDLQTCECKVGNLNNFNESSSSSSKETSIYFTADVLTSGSNLERETGCLLSVIYESSFVVIVLLS